MKIKYLYHSTISNNLYYILNMKMLINGVGTKIAGTIDETHISLSDYFNDYLFIIFGDTVIEFNSDSIFSKNILIPTKYNENEKDFNDMPFEECEWKSKKIDFNYSDISRIISFNNNNSLEICNKLNIKNEIITSTKDLSMKSFDFYKKRYYNRIKNYL